MIGGVLCLIDEAYIYMQYNIYTNKDIRLARTFVLQPESSLFVLACPGLENTIFE